MLLQYKQYGSFPVANQVSSKRVVCIWKAKADIIHWHKWIIIDQHGCEVMLVKCWSRPGVWPLLLDIRTQNTLRNKLSEYQRVSLVLYNQPSIAITFSTVIATVSSKVITYSIKHVKKPKPFDLCQLPVYMQEECANSVQHHKLHVHGFES